ncbi:MAG: sigma-70 family RNA polymerase sigma factor [Acidimicrobiales bacterium]
MDGLTRLAVEARAGDLAALEAFVEASYDQVWRFCSGLTDPSSADDLAQETFLRAVRSLDGFRGDSAARTWLLGIARHVCLDHHRSTARRRRRDSDLHSPVLARRAEWPDVSSAVVVGDLLDRLDPDRRSAFVLTALVGLSYSEAATVCECPVGTIRSRVARARSDLIAWLAEAEEPGIASTGG